MSTSEHSDRRLRDLVGRFYAVHADAFSAKRSRPWRGWRRLLDHLPARRPLRVLDAGCGNGRFGVFLADALGARAIDYRGVDSSPRLLEIAADSLADRGIAHDLVELDLLEDLWDDDPSDRLDKRYDLIALMGVLHHVPGEETRGRLLHRLGQHLADGSDTVSPGLLAATVWRPDDRLVREAVVLDGEPDCEPDCEKNGEPGDLLLPFDGDASTPRFCHAADAAEVERLVAASGLELRARYEADGRDGRGNLYLLFERPPRSC